MARWLGVVARNKFVLESAVTIFNENKESYWLSIFPDLRRVLFQVACYSGIKLL